ncbi:MAG: nitrate transporter substrate-binding protein [Hyphomicrobiales bacterium]|nr:nitrate transporter substrate-binding protein [Hyphomicrobiales bacterium]
MTCVRQSIMAALTCLLCFAPAAAQTELKYGLATVSLTYAPLYVAEDKGFFKDEGVSTQGMLLPGSGPAASATIAGNLDFFVGLPQTAALAGDKLAVFAIVTKEYATDIVVSKEIATKAKISADTPVEKRLDVLKGLRIAAWTPGGSSDMLIRYIAAKKGWSTESDMTLLPIGPAPPMVAAVENGRADAYIISAPASLQGVERLGAYLLYAGARGEWSPLHGQPYMCLIGNREWLEKNKKSAAAVFRGLSRAIAFMQNNPAETKTLLRKRLTTVDDAAFELAYSDLAQLVPSSPDVGPNEVAGIRDFVTTVNPKANVSFGTFFNTEVGKLAGAAPN